MKNRDGLENSDIWATPPELYSKLDSEFGFDFDPCPLNPTFDGLQVEWGKVSYCNPPYNRIDKPRFIQKAYEEWRKGKTVVLLLPASVGTRQFHDLILPNAEVRFVRGRIAFHGVNTKGVFTQKGKGKHDSMIVIFRH
jgi:site-specific DNA-methyltransferase (adenine-specific)